MYFVMLPLGGFYAFIILPIVLCPSICAPSLAPYAPLLMHSYVCVHARVCVRIRSCVCFESLNSK